MSWEPVIGLEIHVQLKTRTKMFCRCAVGFGAGENTQTCPVCLGFPGALPVVNRRAVEWTILLGLALGCEIPGQAVFSRKNYFYPDLPKGYQISQYDLPSCINGNVLLPTADGDRVIGIVRAHLEEDAAKTVHVGGRSGRIGGADFSLVDYNRGGTPLVEIVTAPDIRSADEAKRFLQLLRQTIVELGISDAEMEKGTLRVDANVSVRPAGSAELRTRTEIKNMNSFNFIARGIDAEVERQIAVGSRAARFGRRRTTSTQPRDALPPAARRRRPTTTGTSPSPTSCPSSLRPSSSSGCARSSPSSRRRGFAGSRRLSISTGQPCSSRVGSTGCGRRPFQREPTPWQRRTWSRTRSSAREWIRGGAATELSKLVEARDRIPRGAFDEAIAKLADPGFSADPYLAQESVSDTTELEPIVEAVLAANPGQVEAYRGGKEGLLGFFVGQVMKETQGKADPRVVNELVRAKLSG